MNQHPPFRAEHIGSLVRPPELLRARQEHAAGKLDRARLAAVENDAIRAVVKLQEDVGLQVVTDGEFRRGTYSDSFTSSGITGVSVEMTEDRGFTKSETHEHRMAQRIPTMRAPAHSRRCDSCLRARSWCSAWWRRRCQTWNPPIS